jgi:hypothetical protein
MDPRLVISDVLPDALLGVQAMLSSLASRDLVALSGGHDFVLQVSNAACAETAFASLQLPWIAGRLDAQGVAALRAGGASFTSPLLARAVAAPLGAASPADVLLVFSAHDVLFDAPDQCRVRVGVRVAIGSLLVVPKEPVLVHGLAPGEAVEAAADPIGRVGQALLAAGLALTAAGLGAGTGAPQPLMVRTLDAIAPAGLEQSIVSDRSDLAALLDAERHLDLGARTSFEVSAWLGGGLLEIAAPFAAAGDQASATIRVAADISQSTAHFTELSADAVVLLSDLDPLGLVQATTRRVRQQQRVALVDDVSLVGGPATAAVGHLEAFMVDAFACGQGACALNVTAVIVAGRVASRAAVAFISSSRYGVVWSADAVQVLVRYCWESGSFPRSIMQTSGVRLTIDGVEQTADAISAFRLDTLDVVELEYDSNGRRDVLYTRGSARVVPQLIRLQDGRELIATDLHDPVFAASAPMPWAALGSLTERPLSASSPDLLWFERAVTGGVTSRLGRPFTEPSDVAVVTDSRLSAPQQRVALLVT